MTELVQGKRLVDRDVETTFEEADKRIKLLLRPGEMKARLEFFRQEAESKFAPPAIQEPLIKIRRNLHPPFLGEALEYMREFHKKHSANDLYGLPKACQDTIDLVLTCPDAERVIQKTSDPGLKARFQHIREARVLGFEVDPCTDIGAADLPFSMEDLQYLRYHFEVFSAVSLFGRTADEVARVARLDAYLDIRDARLHYQEQVQALAPRALSISTLPEAVAQDQRLADAAPPHEAITEETEESCCPTLTATESFVADQPSKEGIDPMGPSVIENMEISMVHVLPADFQSRTAQPNFLNGDVVAEEPGHIDFVSVAEGESATKDDGLKAALVELFPRSSSAKLHHLKPLYVTAHIEGYPVSKVFVDCGATVNIMPLNIMKALRRSNDELIPSGITMSSFVGDKSQTKGVLPLTVNIAGRTHMTAFFVVDSKTEYNELLDRDWIHQTSCIPSSLYQVLVFWDGKSASMKTDDRLGFRFRKLSRLAPRLSTRIRRDSDWPISSPSLMSDTDQDKRRAAVSSTMERLLAHWYTISRQPNSGVNLVEFLAEEDPGPALSFDQVQAAPAELEDYRPQVKDPLEEINVGTAGDPRPVFVSALLPQQMKDELRALLTEFKDCFAWSYHEMPGLDRALVEHELRIKPGFKPFRQPPRRFSTEVQLSVKDELVRLLKAGFIRTARYVEWLANIVPVLKKSGKMKAFSTLLKLKDSDKFVWNEEHQAAFTQIKVSLTNPPVLVPPQRGKPLKLYISAAEESIGCLLAQDNDAGREHVIFYLSRNLSHPEINYSAVEKLCLAVFFAASKLQHYMLPTVTQVITQTDVLRYMLTRPIVKGRIGKWTMVLSEFSLQYMPQKAVKGQVLADFLAQHPSPYGFGSANVEIGMAEYEALVIGLGLLLDLHATRVLVLGDSELVINQINGSFRCMSCTLASYHMVASYLAESFDGITFEYVSRVHNTDADELAQIASANPPSRQCDTHQGHVPAVVVRSAGLYRNLHGRGSTR
ncbi:uncharacterized protein [Malus domestica]|uniref:uncharacterized protein n=1 Tax=Malus domestica TaxID=3750 RepID=UPI003974AD03